MYVLIDSNNFFVSCERLFRPDLYDKPVIVLSSNDGCAVARSNEAKALGVKMGEPLHVLRDRFTIIDGTSAPREREREASGGVEATLERSDESTSRGASSSFSYTWAHKPPLVAFSANFTLYGDISRRIGSVIARVTPRIEFYSIDEAFLDVSTLDIADYTAWGRELAAQIWREVGVPVSVGIAPTKTLCKLAADYAKHHPETQGCSVLQPPSTNKPLHSGGASEKRTEEWRLLSNGVMRVPQEEQAPLIRKEKEHVLDAPIQDVWGVGWRLAPKLKAMGVHTAADLATMRPQLAQQLMGVHGRRMVAELQGTPCIPLNTTHKPQQVISRGRQFGHDTSDLAVVSAAVARMTNHAAVALRREGLLACHATVWLSTNRKKPGYTVLHRDVHFYTPTGNTGVISRQLLQLLEHDFDTRHAWHKAEVTLWDLISDQRLQTDVFGAIRPEQYSRSQMLMTALDSINHRYGTHTLHYAAENLSEAWRPRHNLLSPSYTTSWQSLPVLHA